MGRRPPQPARAVLFLRVCAGTADRRATGARVQATACYSACMNVPDLRSPYEEVGGIVHFARMLDKIRLHAEGKLPADYQPNLGKGFDARCSSFLGVQYEDVVARVKLGGADEDILTWCFEQGRKPS